MITDVRVRALTDRVDLWRWLVAGSLLCAVARGITAFEAVDSFVMVAQFGLLALALLTLWLLPPRGPRAAPGWSHAFAVLFSMAAAITAAWSPVPIASLARAAIYLALLLLVLETARIRWVRPGVLAADLQLLFWFAVALSAIGLALGLLGVPDMWGPYNRFKGLTVNATVAAWIAAIAFPFGYARLLDSSWRARVAPLLGIAVLAGAVLASGTRGALIALVGGVLVIHLLRLKSWVLGVSIVGGLLVLVTAIGTGLLPIGRLAEPLSDVSSGRFELWQAGIALWLERPLFGWGFGSTSTLAGFAGQNGMSTHNAYITVLLETGAVGLVIFLALLASLFLGWVKRPAPAILAAAMAVFVNGFFESSLVNLGSPVTLQSWLVLAAVVGAGGALWPLTDSRSHRVSRASSEESSSVETVRDPTPQVVSVCMAAYNGSAHIREQIDSILPELEEHDELVVVDDGSTDDTVEIVMSYADSRIRLVRNDVNLGHIRTFERALSESSGHFVFLTDQDDVWVQGRVGRMRRALLDNAMVATSFGVLGEGTPSEEGRLRKSDSHRRVGNYVGLMAGRRSYFGCAMGIRADLLSRALPFPKDVEAHDHWLAILGIVSGELAHLEEETVLRRIHANNLTPRSRRGLAAVMGTRVRMIRHGATAWLRLNRISDPRPTRDRVLHG